MGRVALVTGGVSGIGAATCLALAAAGRTVVANWYGNDADAAAFHERTGAPTFCWDVADFDACQSGVDDVARQFGPIEILINNAGITRDATLHKMTHEQWRAVIDVDLGGCFNMCHAVIGAMRDRCFGRIVNVSSINALSGQFGQTNYAAATAGILGFTKSLALEGAARGITVNAITPGYTDTAMVAAVQPDILKSILATVPLGRLGEPAEIARAIAFLASDEAGFITGETLSVNGGKYMK